MSDTYVCSFVSGDNLRKRSTDEETGQEQAWGRRSFGTQGRGLLLPVAATPGLAGAQNPGAAALTGLGPGSLQGHSHLQLLQRGRQMLQSL